MLCVVVTSWSAGLDALPRPRKKWHSQVMGHVVGEGYLFARGLCRAIESLYECRFDCYQDARAACSDIARQQRWRY